MASKAGAVPSQGPGFRKFIQSITERQVLVPHLQAALATRGSRSWPEEFSIKVDNKERHFDGLFHPSSHAAMPALLLYYLFHPEHRAKLVTTAEGAQDVMTLMIGSALHSVVQTVLMELGFAEREDIEYGYRSDFRQSTGKLDVRKITLPGLDENPMVEIKTIGRVIRVKEAPLPEHVLQMQPYLDLGAEFPDWGVILYIEKTWPHQLKEHRVYRDQRAVDAIYEKWRAVREAIAVSDPSLLTNCPECMWDNPVHQNCEARFVCRIGPPSTGWRPR